MIDIREQYAEAIAKCNDCLDKAKKQESYDVEYAHSVADDALCELLMAMGLFDIVHKYDEIDKWYA